MEAAPTTPNCDSRRPASTSWSAELTAARRHDLSRHPRCQHRLADRRLLSISDRVYRPLPHSLLPVQNNNNNNNNDTTYNALNSSKPQMRSQEAQTIDLSGHTYTNQPTWLQSTCFNLHASVSLLAGLRPSRTCQTKPGFLTG